MDDDFVQRHTCFQNLVEVFPTFAFIAEVQLPLHHASLDFGVVLQAAVQVLVEQVAVFAQNALVVREVECQAIADVQNRQ